MNKRLMKFYTALIMIGAASYLFFLSLQGKVTFLRGLTAPLDDDLGFVLSVVGMAFGGFLGWRTVIEELAVKSD